MGNLLMLGLASLVTERAVPKSVSDLEVLKEYLLGVIDRAEHHADDVDAVSLALVGAVLWRMDKDSLRVFEREGEMKNVLWVTIQGARYTFSYDHKAKKIVLRRGSTQGELVASFSNATAVTEIRDVFSKL
jgi:hypothetical protein